ncbi:MAG: SURF1 family protein [Nevskia sp.]|nr:SURF1 family protein [Nevskia sp.]
MDTAQGTASPRRFRPPLWAVLATVAACSAFAVLGTWQLRRGLHKQALLQDYSQATSAVPMDLAQAVPQASIGGVAAQAHGEYEADRQLLLDGQEHGDDSGYDVWTPLRLPGGGLLIVNRGWIPAGRDRRSFPPLPAPPGTVSLRGIWRALPEPGLQLGGPQCVPGQAPGGWPRVVVYPTADDLRCYYGEPVAAGELLLDAAAPGGYVRQWQAAAGVIPPARHFAYAAQWFAFALAALVLFVKLNLKSVP